MECNRCKNFIENDEFIYYKETDTFLCLDCADYLDSQFENADYQEKVMLN